jgi:peptide/nickel transport system substrate-binding protein
MRRSACLPAFLAGAFALAPIIAQPSPVTATTIPHVLRFAAAEDVATLNPDLNLQGVVLWLSQMTAAYLFRLDNKNSLVPELATVVPTQQNGGVSRDGKTITLHLRKGVKWSDGVPFDSSDVAFSIAAINNPANNIADRSGFDQIARVEEPDKFTVIVHLKTPVGAIVYRLFASNQGGALLPKHILGALPDMNTAAYNSLPVGIGPFRYKAWKRGDEIELEANPNYWRGRPALSEVIYKLIPDRNTVLTQLETGELDMWVPFGGVYLSRVSAIENLHVIRHPSYIVNQILFNTTSGPLEDRVVRQALRFAVDRQEIRDKVGHGVGIVQNVPFPEVDPEVPRDIAITPYDLAKANALLDADGWKRGADGIRVKDGQRLEVPFVSSTGTPDGDTSIEIIRSSWKQIGVDMSVQRYLSALLFGPYASGGILANGKFGAMFLGNEIAAPLDVANVYACKSFPPAGQNYYRFCDPKLEPLIARYSGTIDSSERAKLLSAILHVVDDQSIAVIAYAREDLFGVSNAVKNFAPNNATPFDDMMHVDVVP